MSSSTPMPRPLALTRQISVALALVLFPSVASAHTKLRRSEPAKGSRLTIPPAAIQLWFTARPQIPFSRVRLFGAAGEIALGAIVADTGNGLHAPIATTLPPGDYRVEWQTASADGHPLRGEFTFAVVGIADSSLAPAPTMPASIPDSASTRDHSPAPESHAGHSEYRTARWFEFAALLTVLGAFAFRHGVLPPLAARGVPTSDAADRARRLGMVVIVVYLVAALLRVYTESEAVHGAGRALDRGELVAMMTGTTWGIGWLFGTIGALLLATGWALSKRSVVMGTPLALTGVLGMVFSPALSGHAAASAHFIISVVLDVVHIAAAGVWIGGLLMVLIAGIPAMHRLTTGNQNAAVSALVNSFHPLALFCAPLVVLAGVGTSWIRLGSPGAVWSTQYGRMLLLKLAAVLLVAGMGTYNSLRARRRLGAPEATSHIRVTGTVELIFAAFVLGVTTVLVSSPVPTEIVAP